MRSISGSWGPFQILGTPGLEQQLGQQQGLGLQAQQRRQQDQRQHKQQVKHSRSLAFGVGHIQLFRWIITNPHWAVQTQAVGALQLEQATLQHRIPHQ